MSIERKYRRQKAVLFTKTGTNDFGECTFATGVEIDVRWSQNRENSPHGTADRIIYEHKVLIGQDVSLGDWICLGTLASMNSTTDPVKNAIGGPVKAFRPVVGLKGEISARFAML